MRSAQPTGFVIETYEKRRNKKKFKNFQRIDFFKNFTIAFGDVVFRRPIGSGMDGADAQFLLQRRIEDDTQLFASAAFRNGRHDVDSARSGMLTFFHFGEPFNGQQRDVRVASFAAGIGSGVAAVVSATTSAFAVTASASASAETAVRGPIRLRMTR